MSNPHLLKGRGHEFGHAGLQQHGAGQGGQCE